MAPFQRTTCTGCNRIFYRPGLYKAHKCIPKPLVWDGSSSLSSFRSSQLDILKDNATCSNWTLAPYTDHGLTGTEMILRLWKEYSKDMTFIRGALEQGKLHHVYCRHAYSKEMRKYYVPISPQTCDCDCAEPTQDHEHWLGYALYPNTQNLVRKEIRSLDAVGIAWRAKQLRGFGHFLAVVFYMQTNGGSYTHHHIRQSFQPPMKSKRTWFSVLLENELAEAEVGPYRTLLLEAAADQMVYAADQEIRKQCIKDYFEANPKVVPSTVKTYNKNFRF